MASTHASLDAAATERKARLAKLASLKRKQPHPSPPPDNDNNDSTITTNGHKPQPHSPSKTTTTTSPPQANEPNPHLSHRNYDPLTNGPKLGFEHPPNLSLSSLSSSTLESRAAALATSTTATATASEIRAEKGIELADLAPRKANWDLKRDLARKMEVLGGRTDNAIVRLVRERVEGEARRKRGVDGVDGGKEGEGEEVGIEGVDLVEGVHVRERELEEEVRREREEGDMESEED